MAATSQVRAENRFDMPVSGWQQARLLKPSVIKPVIATMEQGLVIRQLGRLSTEDRRALVEGLRAVLR